MKTKELFKTSLTNIQQKNSQLNKLELCEGKTILSSHPRRIVFELTNRCNFRCIMCGREASVFRTYDLPMEIIRNFESYFPYIEEVTLHGWGEGTLHPRFIEILKLLNSYPMLRKYFVTNASTLSKIRQAIFDHHVDVLAVSMDGSTAETNNAIRRGGDFNREISELRQIITEKNYRNLDYPYINFVFTAMQRNLHELPGMITLARDLGLPEVKVVYLTVFKQDLLGESLMDRQSEVRDEFNKASNLAERLNIRLKLPEIQGEGEAGTLRHKPCPFPWRDLYIGSDGFIRPCQSSPQKLVHAMEFKTFDELWNSGQMQELRHVVDDDKQMSTQCYYCYHSTCANWNLRHSFFQLEQGFTPEWEAGNVKELTHV